MGCYLAKPITDKEVEDIADKGTVDFKCSMTRVLQAGK